MKLVNVLITNTKGEGKAGDEFWTKAETLLYTALISYICTHGPEKERNFGTLVSMINAMEVREEDEDFKNVVDQMFDELEKKEPQHFAVRQYRKFKLAAGKTAKSILISCAARLAPFDIQEIRDIISEDELELDTIGDTPTAVFFIISDTDDSLNFLVSMAYTQMFNLLCEKADDHYNGRLPVHVRCLIDECANIGQIPKLEKLMATIRSREISASLCLIDECANIGQIPKLEKLMATIRSREISASLILQTQSQLKALYKDNCETIIGNCDAVLFLGGKEKTTLKDLTETLGKETIDIANTGESRGREKSYSTNFQELCCRG